MDKRTRRSNRHTSALDWRKIGVGAGLAAGAAAAWIWHKRRTDGSQLVSPEQPMGHRAALVKGEVEPANFDQTRNAGPESIRSEVRNGWDKIDEAVDESFPSSDPPSY